MNGLVAETPTVTVLIANYNGSGFIEAAIRSAQRQTLRNIEILVVDDASTDDSPSRVERCMSADARIRLERLDRNQGPGGSRNHGLDAARGDWIAILDADDLMHPERLADLVSMAEADDADMVADDLLLFNDAAPGDNGRMLFGRRARSRTWIGLEDYLGETLLLRSRANLGYLKPLIRTRTWRETGVRYDPALRIGEDDDLICRLLAAGLRYRLSPRPQYFYRRHDQSISHRLTLTAVERMAAQEAAFRALFETRGAAAPSALDRRRAAIADARGFVRLIDALKSRNPVQVAKVLAGRPSAALLLRIPVRDRLMRALSRKPTTATTAGDGRDICLISRQRLIGRVNGSSTYLLDLVDHLARNGWRTHLLQPSPGVMGRWPVMRLKPDMAVFASIRLRGAWRVGDMLLSRNPAVYLAALRFAAGKLLRRIGLGRLAPEDRPAPYAVAAPYADEDLLFVARHAPGISDRLLLDYMFQVRAAPYALRPDARSAVVMHDLFSARAEQFGAVQGKDSVESVTEDEEIALLGRADAVIAIQRTEADWVSRRVGGVTVLEVPHPARPVPAAAPGDDDLVLFVGSNTAPNVIGLEWFLNGAWPVIAAARPAAKLLVAGSVARAVTASLPSVKMLGVVEDLGDLYRRAGLVVSPLTTGSGLKIKLIEALAQGKAIVATSVTLQGVEQAVGPGVAIADTPEAFAAQVLRLIGDRPARGRLADAALTIARTHFAADACYGPVTRWFDGG